MQTTDTYRLYSEDDARQLDMQVLVELYQPIIGYQAIAVYLSFWGELKLDRLTSVESTWYRLSLMTHMDLNQIEQAITKLSAIGLVNQYLKQGETDCYMIELLLPKTPSAFFNHALLVASLHHQLTALEFEKTKFLFLKPVMDLQGYQKQTHDFKTVFGTQFDQEDEAIYNQVHLVKTRKEANPQVNMDATLLKQQLKVYQIEERFLTQEVLETVDMMQTMYQLTIMELAALLMQVYQVHGFELEQFKVEVARYYDNQVVPKKLSSVYHHQPVKDQSRHIGNPTIERMDKLSCFDYLRYLLGKQPNRKDLMVVEGLMQRFDLNPGVVNVILDYTIQKEGRLVKRYVESIASTMKVKQIKTVEAAMIEIKKATQKTKNKVQPKTSIQYEKETTVEDDVFDDLMMLIKEDTYGTN